ncbi:MAG: NAD(P)-dependent glycerol-3-phosphate dehydrogenase [Deltaproteobacteria bacterium]|nr:NAD(P)-dependent glycerol-3-phosphate dehydrogenase [Deltaproteobacteria bacterium]
MTRTAILGAGAFGTALAAYTAALGHDVRVWAFEKDLPAAVAESGVNETFLPGVKLPASIRWTNDMADALTEAELVSLMCPSAFVRRVATQACELLPENALIVSAAKGIEHESLCLMSQVLTEVLPAHVHRLCFMSGPSFAREIAQGLPADVAMAAHDIAVARRVQQLLHSPRFRVYTSADVIGVELGGALKNVIAVGCGAADGLGFGDSARASLMTRGLAEITRLGVAMGANPLTFLGLAGVGDLILTCTGDLSRNRQLGKRLAKGEKPEEIVASQKAVAEGYVTAKPVYQLSRKLGVDMPITEAVYRVCYEGVHLLMAAMGLMNRESKDELAGIFFAAPGV